MRDGVISPVPRSHARPSDGSNGATIATGLIATTLVAWSIGLTGVFQFDDVPNIVLDRATSDLAALWHRLGNGFRPLLRLSYVIDHAIWGFAPAGFLLTNLLIHCGTVLAVWQLARRLLSGPHAAAAAALVFALQPAHAAAVASASGRSTGLSTLLLVLALLAHERASERRSVIADTAGKSTIRWTPVSVLLFALAVATKEVALIFPALLLLIELTRHDRADLATIARRVAPAGATAVFLCAAAFAFSARLREIVAYSLALGSPVDALIVHAAALPYSLSLWLQPWQLAVEHAPLPASAALPGLSALALWIACAAYLYRRARLATLAMLWPLIMLIPSHTVLMRSEPIVEKALYGAWIGPSLGIGTLIALALARCNAMTGPQRQRDRLRIAGAALTFVMLTSCCAWRAARWADPAALWQEATERSPQSSRAWHNRALTELDAGRYAAAARSVAIAIELNPDSFRSQELALTISLLAGPTVQVPVDADISQQE